MIGVVVQLNEDFTSLEESSASRPAKAARTSYHWILSCDKSLKLHNSVGEGAVGDLNHRIDSSSVMALR